MRAEDVLSPKARRKTKKALKKKLKDRMNDTASREFDSCLQFFTNQIAQNVDYINAFEFFYCQIR